MSHPYHHGNYCHDDNKSVLSLSQQILTSFGFSGYFSNASDSLPFSCEAKQVNAFYHAGWSVCCLHVFCLLVTKPAFLSLPAFCDVDFVLQITLVVAVLQITLVLAQKVGLHRSGRTLSAVEIASSDCLLLLVG